MIATDFTNLKVAFKTFHGNYLRADLNTNIVKTAPSIAEWEFWTIIPLDNKTEFAIRSFHNRYLAALGRHEGDTLEQSTNLGPWERFRLINPSDDLWAIQSVAHGSYIRTCDNGTVDMQVNMSDWEKYSIKFISKPKIVKNLKYKFDEKEIISEKLMTIFTITLENHHIDKSSDFKYVFKKGISKSFVFTQNYGADIVPNTKLFAGIPEVVEGISTEDDISYETEWDWTPATEIITTIPIQFEANVNINPGESVRVSLIAFRRQLNVPWTAMAFYKIDDKEIKKDIGGVWNGTVIFNIRVRTM